MPKPTTPPTVVLVHGALTDASVWRDVTLRLQQRGFAVVAPSMPLRGLASDAAYLHTFLTAIDGPIVLVGHSYAGSVISDPAATTPDVKALVYVAAFQPEQGETTAELNALFPGSGLGPDTTRVVEHADGSDLYLRTQDFREVYAGDVAPAAAAVMAAAQKPINPAALHDVLSGPATWHSLPSWSFVSSCDKSLPTAALRFMANRAGSTVVEVESSHAAPLARSAEVSALVEQAIAGPWS